MRLPFSFGGALTLLCANAVLATAHDPVINEFVNNHTGTDTNEYIEFFHHAGSNLSAFWVVEIEGDSTSAGLIDDATFQLGTTDSNGIWWTGFQPNIPENGTLTYLLVENFTGAVGDDIDTNNDGTIDVTFWDRIVDTVGVFDGGASDLNYADTVLDSSLLPSGFTVGGASRIPNGVDTNSVSDWRRNAFNGEGIPGLPGGPLDPNEALNTPGELNVIPEPATFALFAIGGLVLMRRR